MFNCLYQKFGGKGDQITIAKYYAYIFKKHFKWLSRLESNEKSMPPLQIFWEFSFLNHLKFIEDE